MTAGNQPSSSGSAGPSPSEFAELVERMETFADHGCSPNHMETAQELIADALLIIRNRAAAQPPRTPLDLSASELNTLATDAFREGAQGSAVAWIGEYDGHLDTTIYRDTMERWKALGRKITPLYAVTPSPGPGAWTTDQFWEYVGGLAGAFEAGQMCDMMAAKGLSITSTSRCTCQDQHRRGYCTESGCPYAVSSTKSGGGA